MKNTLSLRQGSKRSIDLHVQQEIIRSGSLLLKMERPRPEN